MLEAVRDGQDPAAADRRHVGFDLDLVEDGPRGVRPRAGRAPLQPDRLRARRRLRDAARLGHRLRRALDPGRRRRLHQRRPQREVPARHERGDRPRDLRGPGRATAAAGWCWPRRPSPTAPGGCWRPRRAPAWSSTCREPRLDPSRGPGRRSLRPGSTEEGEQAAEPVVGDVQRRAEQRAAGQPGRGDRALPPTTTAPRPGRCAPGPRRDRRDRRPAPPRPSPRATAARRSGRPCPGPAGRDGRPCRAAGCGPGRPSSSTAPPRRARPSATPP